MVSEFLNAGHQVLQKGNNKRRLFAASALHLATKQLN